MSESKYWQMFFDGELRMSIQFISVPSVRNRQKYYFFFACRVDSFALQWSCCSWDRPCFGPREQISVWLCQIIPSSCVFALSKALNVFPQMQYGARPALYFCRNFSQFKEFDPSHALDRLLGFFTERVEFPCLRQVGDVFQIVFWACPPSLDSWSLWSILKRSPSAHDCSLLDCCRTPLSCCTCHAFFNAILVSRSWRRNPLVQKFGPLALHFFTAVSWHWVIKGWWRQIGSARIVILYLVLFPN